MTDLERITQSVEKRAEKICQVNDQVWEYAELAFHEFRSADTICQVLEEEGFTVERGLAGIPRNLCSRKRQTGHGHPGRI